MQFKIKLTSPFVGLLLMLATTQAISALLGESIVLDPRTGDYTITYWDYPKSPKKQLQKAVFVPATKIDPLVKSTFKIRENDEVAYAYRVSNGARSRQSLVSIRFDPVSDIVSALPLPKNEQDVDPNIMEQIIAAGMDALATPNGWNGGSYTSQSGGLRISWSYATLHSDNDGLKPGNTQGGFGFISKDIPGIGIAQLSGHSPVPGWPDEGPEGDIANEFETIEQNDFVPRNAAIPTIAVPVPFDAAVLLDSIRAHVATWPSKQLLNPAFATRIDRYLVAAADANRFNQPKAAKEHIDALRKLLEGDHKYLDHDDEDNDDTLEHKHATRNTIDRLAARVLDFDLRYVLKRMEREHEHEHGDGDRRKEQEKK